ncbi:MAG: hypothetical protein JWO69_513, partial [Thermoleophilia bacterium]|nr:hypothetical protein [Thermoleophilia bacterium]
MTRYVGMERPRRMVRVGALLALLVVVPSAPAGSTSQDTGFGVDGLYVDSFGVAPTHDAPIDGVDVIALPDGASLVLGNHHKDAVVQRLRHDGTLDTSFGVAGTAMVLGGTEQFLAATMAVTSDGSILVSGAVGPRPIRLYDNSVMAIARLHADGSIDHSFGTSGLTRVAAGENASSMSLLADGRILVASGHGALAGIVRLSADGVLDTAYGSNGYARPGQGGVMAIAAYPGGKVAYTSSQGSSWYVGLLDAAGLPDSTFGYAQHCGCGRGSTTVSFGGP